MTTTTHMGDPGSTGRFGEFGGRYVPETLVPACQQLEAAFRDRFGKPVDIILRTAPGWLRLAAQNPFSEGSGAHIGIRVMRKPLGPDLLPRLEAIATPDMRLALRDGDLWIDFAGAPSEAKLLSHLTTKKLGIGTLRNANTVKALAAMLT